MPFISMAKYKDKSGMRFGKLVVIDINCRKDDKIWWNCKCDCGGSKVISSSRLNNEWDGATNSCGCLAPQNAVKHGRCYTMEYKRWQAMIARCTNPKAENYYKYGGRGITIDPRWRNSFEEFYKDMGDLPASNYTLERQDVNGNYELSNCIWLPLSEQAKNTRTSRKITYLGKTLILKDWARLIGVEHSTLREHLFTKSFHDVIENYVKWGRINIVGGEIISNKDYCFKKGGTNSKCHK